MATINRVPRGLLALLDAKTLGRTPPDLEDRVRGMLDLTELYAGDVPLLTTAAVEGTLTVGGNFAPVTVPAGELWWVYCVSVYTVQTDSSNYGSAVPNYFTAAAGGGLGVSLASYATQISTASGLDAAVNSSGPMIPPLVVGPGGRFTSFYIRDVGTGAASVTTNVLYRSFQV